MKLTKSKLKQLIKEELQNVLQEQEQHEDCPWALRNFENMLKDCRADLIKCRNSNK